MSKAGWYPDPGGQQGMFRWWDGQSWTPTLTANPYAPPPAPPGALPLRDGGQGPSTPYAATPQARRGGSPMLVLALVGMLVVGLVLGGVWLLGGARNPFGSGEQPASNPTADVCPPRPTEVESAQPRVFPPGRVQGGRLSYPQLGSPWGAVEEEARVPFGRDVFGQSVMVEPNYDGSGSSWVASVVVGELVAGDGFFSPQQGAEIVTRCIMGVFYSDAVLDRTDRVNQATSVDGYDAWIVEMHLAFEIEGLAETGETAVILIVATSTESSSLYYASIPDSRPELLATARQVQADLRVEP